MLAEHNFEAEAALGPKRCRRLSTQIQQGSNVPRKRQAKNCTEDQNPYQSIPEIPSVKLTDDDMKSDPIELFIKLEERYKDFGAVKVTVSDNWRCPFQQRFVDKGITTRIQYLSKLKQGKAFEQNVESYNFRGYESYALNFERTYKFKTQPKGKTLESRKQHQYWSLVTKPEYEKSNVKVEYAADLASTKYGSGFPVHFNPKNNDSKFVYQTSLFNLNNIMNSPSSVLGMTAERKEKVSGITHPWVYMGCLFSTFCWHVQDLGVNSLNYNHKGAIKTWYVVPSSHKQRFDNYIKAKYCLNSHKQTLLNRITFMVDPLEIMSAGIPVCKAYQRPRDFICTFFSAYHCGFSQGYNIGEAVNFMSPLSIQVMIKFDKERKANPKSSPNVIPIQWIIYENYQRLKKFKEFGQKIAEAYWEMIYKEKSQIQEYKKEYETQKIVKFSGIKKYDKIYCSSCKEYLYMRYYKVSDKKNYCYEHLKKEIEPKTKVTLCLRSPNEDRKYILSMFEKIAVQQEKQEVEKRGKPKSMPKLTS